MRTPFASGPAASLLERAGAPLPSGVVATGSRPVIVVGAQPFDPSNAVLVALRRNGGAPEFLRVVPEHSAGEAQRWFRAQLPALGAGHTVSYRVELVSSGELLATHPADGSWLTVTATAAGVEEPPYWNYDMHYVGSVTVIFRQEVIGATPDGYHVNFFIEGGRVTGPGIDATIRAEGADWLWIRSDGIAAIDVRATWETADGALISYRSGGVIELGPDGYTRLVAGQLTGSPPFCCTINLLTAHPRYEWLNRLQLIGIGRIDLEGLEIAYDVYTPEIKERARRA
jgi:hypothetical protein